MKLWRIWQTDNNDYDTYDSAVVAAETEEAARQLHPGRDVWLPEKRTWQFGVKDWAPFDSVSAMPIGDAAPGTEAGVICASFNAG